jgi:hypothetical protein
MKKILFTLPLVLLGLISCSPKAPDPPPPCDGSTCPDPTATVAPTATTTPTATGLPTTPTTQVLADENWEFAIPATWVKIARPEPIPEVKSYYGHAETRNLIIFIKEPFAGLAGEYALQSLRGLKDSGARLASAKQVDINGNKFVLIDADRDGIQLYIWITAKNGFGYVLSCGGPATAESKEELCQSIANSLKIN